MTVLQIELADPTAAGWPLHVTFRGEMRSGLLYQQAGLPYRAPDGTVLVPKPAWWLRIRDPESDEWLGDVDEHFLNYVGAAVRRLWGPKIDEWGPGMRLKSPPADAGPRLLPKMPRPEHTRRKP